MRPFWTALLRKSAAALLGYQWNDVCDIVRVLMEKDLPGEEKRRIALQQLKFMGQVSASWLLSAAIEIAYGQLKDAKSD